MAPSKSLVFALIVATTATLHLTAARSPAPLPKAEGPCYEATDPKLWPVKAESRVCGTDGLLYPSKKALECAKTHTTGRTTLAMQPRDKCGVMAKLYDPCPMAGDSLRNVCGSDNVTYTNAFDMACTARKNSVEIRVQNAGECKIEYPYSPIYKPVCSTSGKTFPTEEALRTEQIRQPYSKTEMKSAGACPSDVSKDPCVPIANEYSPKPLCASNGHTYATLREIRCLKKTKPMLKVQHQGACTVQDIEKMVGHNEVCKAAINTYKVKPICGSNNVTYNDAFTVLCSAKNTPKDASKKLKVEYEAACFPINACPDPPASEIPFPVCGSDGIFYSNENDFICAKLTTKTLKKANPEYCSSQTAGTSDRCSKNYLAVAQRPNAVPVCGSNKVTYVSQLDLFCASRTKPDLELLHTGECF